MNTEERNIPIVHHLRSARLKKRESFLFNWHDYGNHANLLVQKLTKPTFSAQGAEKRVHARSKNTKFRCGIQDLSRPFFKKWGFRSSTS